MTVVFNVFANQVSDLENWKRIFDKVNGEWVWVRRRCAQKGEKK